MMLLLLLVPVLMSSAQNNEDAVTNWLKANLPEYDAVNKPADMETQLNLHVTPRRIPCSTANGEDGECVKPSNCGKAEEPKPDFRQGYQPCRFNLVCCPLPDVKEPKKKRKIKNVCGISNGYPFVYRSRNTKPVAFADFAEFPWMVAVLRQSNSEIWNNEDYIGGGTLIHPLVVLTVAHKVDNRDPAELKCRAGEWDTSTAMEVMSHQDRRVRKISVHKDFMLVRNHYNAALLFLESPFILESHIGVACLPGNDLPSIGTLCYSMGWGRTFNDSSYSAQLKKVQLPLVDPSVCQRQLRNTVLGSSYLLHHTLMCAGGEVGVDTCVGDGGAPLVCPIQEGGSSARFAVYGLVSHGVGCGNTNVPGLYTKVSEVVDWVNEEMDREGLDRTYII
ncbi:phenoloxidase-activating factor 2-like [Epargyreus clarus]|uniref:phenoloxidase-activating factor 2-like n=1 Tax=Epargyreus clarus TaxID=520877 RepID=UPI003C2D1972